MTERQTALTESAAPAVASSAAASQSEPASPAAAIARPQTQTEATVIFPSRRAEPSHPVVSAATAAPLRQLRAQAAQRRDQREAAQRVDRVGGLDASGGDEQPAEAGPDDHRQLKEAEVQRQRRRDVLTRDEVRDDRRSGDVLQRSE